MPLMLLNHHRHHCSTADNSKHLSPTGKHHALDFRFPDPPNHLLVTNQQRARTLRKLGFALCCHSNATGAPIANPPNSAQLGGSLYHAPKLHPGPCSSMLAYGRGQTDTQTDRQTDRHTDVRDHNTFCVVYDSRKM